MAPSTPAQLALNNLYDAVRRELEEQFLGRSEALDRREAQLQKRERGLEDRLEDRMQMLEISDIVALPSPCRAQIERDFSQNGACDYSPCCSSDAGISSLDKSAAYNNPAACTDLALVVQDSTAQNTSGFPAGTSESEYSISGEFAPEPLGGQRPLRAMQEKPLETPKELAGDVCDYGSANRPRSASLRALAKSRVPCPVEGQRLTNKENHALAGFPSRNPAAMRPGMAYEHSKRLAGSDQGTSGPPRMPHHRRSSTGSLHWPKSWTCKPREEAGLPNVGGSSMHGLR